MVSLYGIVRGRRSERREPEVHAAKVSIRDCVATPSQIVLFLEGDLDPERLQRYGVAKAEGPSPAFVVDSVAELDVRAGVTVFRNPVSGARVGDWLRVDVFPPLTQEPEATYFARLRSDLPLNAVAPVGRRAARDASAASGHRGSLFSDPALMVVVAGLIVLAVLGVVAMLSASTSDMGPISTAAFGVIGSVVGAFFGVRAGLGDRERVDRERRLEATKGQMLAAMMPEENKKAALDVMKEYSD
jgi:uncharacterized membrane protein YeaQ/YmgE (transglycosylase-associated protein family)